MITVAELIEKIQKYNPNVDCDLIKKAYIFSKGSHGDQKRHSGEPYFSHPLAVAEIVIELKMDQDSIITALLHDVVEDTKISLADIEENFGRDVAKLVDGITKLGKIGTLPSNERVAENFRKLAMAMSQDIRVLLIKLADRLHNMRTLFHVPSKEQKLKKAQECLDIYAPLAARIGLDKIKNELQDLSFSVIDPKSRNYINECLDQLREKNRNLIKNIIARFEELMKEEGIDCKIRGREKKPYSIWLNMRKKNIGFHNLHDIIAFRIITKNISECYRVLGALNSNYNMIPGTFKDYISTPKENGYQSIHLVTLGPFNKKVEIQICDERMREVAENGVAAHWNYKDKYSKSVSGESIKLDQDHEQYRWIKELISLFENSDNASEALKNYKFSMHASEVFCFTPNGDIFNLPFGSSVIDFAYEVHSDIGNSCYAAKVNGIIAPLRKKLENGDQVEIITSKDAKPSPNWLQFVHTSKARAAISSFIRSEKTDEYSKLGKVILEKFFKARDLEISDKIIESVLHKLSKKTVKDVYIRVADGTISRGDVLKATYPEYFEKTINNIQTKQSLSKTVASDYSIPIEGLLSGMAIKYGLCCNPIPGDPIAAVINTGTGVTIHNQRCKNLKNLAISPQRVISVCWKEGEKFTKNIYSTKLRVLVENKSGSLADVSSIISQHNVEIKSIKTIGRSSDCFELMVDIEVSNLNHLEKILSALKMSNKIIEAERIFNL